MTRDEFIDAYVAGEDGQASREQILAVLAPIPCDCGQERCKGWQMVSRWDPRALAVATDAFIADVKAQGIHVGVGDPPVCATCDVSWPCQPMVEVIEGFG